MMHSIVKVLTEKPLLMSKVIMRANLISLTYKKYWTTLERHGFVKKEGQLCCLTEKGYLFNTRAQQFYEIAEELL